MRCPTCGGLNTTKKCSLCEVRQLKRSRSLPVIEKPPIPLPELPKRDFAPKWCKWCGTQLKRKNYEYRIESPHMFAKRQYCGRDCARAHHAMKMTNGEMVTFGR